MRRALRYAGLALLSIALVLVGALVYLQTDHGRALLIAEIEAAATTPESGLKIGAIEGFLPIDFSLSDLALSDREGDWLGIDRVEISWSPLALLAGRAAIDRIAVNRIDLSRSPAASASPEPPKDEPFTWPSLPVAIDLGSLTVAEIALADAFLGEPAQFTLAAKAQLGDAAAGLALDLDLRRMGGPTDNITVAITFLPALDKLDVDLAIHEPRGGLLTKTLGLADAPDLRIEASGAGPLSDWQGRLAATLNGNSLMELTAGVKGRERHDIELAASLMPAPLLPPDLRPILAGGLDIVMAAAIPADAEAIDLAALNIDSEAAHISAKGRIGLQGGSDLGISIRADTPAILAGLLPDIAFESIALDGRATGTWPALDIDLAASVLSLAALGNRVATSDLALTLSGDDLLQEPIAFDALLNAAGISLGQAQADALLADGITLGVNGTLDLAGNALLDSLDLVAGPVALNGHAVAENWGAGLTAALHLTASDLARVGKAGTMNLSGAIAADLGLTMDAGAMSVDLDARASALATGVSQVDGLLGPAPQIVAAFSRGADASIDVQSLSLQGQAVTVTAKGAVMPAQTSLTADINIADLAAIDPGASGALNLKAAVDGTLAAPRLQADLSSPRLGFGDIAADNLKVNLTASDLATAPQASISGNADLLGYPARLRLAVATEAASGAIRIDNLALQHGPSAVSGAVRVLNGVADGKLKLAISSLAPYAPLVGSDLDGSVLGDIALRDGGGQQDVELDLTASGIALSEDLRIGSIRVVGSVADASGMQAIDARLDVAALVTPQIQFDNVALTARGDAAAMDVDLAAAGPEASLDMQADLARSPEQIAAEIASLRATLRGETLALRQPARIVLAGERVEIAGLDLGYGDGGMALDGSLSPVGNDLALRINRLSLGILRMVDPAQQVAGTIDGNLSLGGPAGTPVADFDLSASDIALDRTSGLTIGANLRGAWRDDRLQATSRVDFSTGGGLDLTAALGLPADPASGLPRLDEDAALDARAAGDLDLAVVNRLLAGGADRIAGKLTVDLAARGTLANPNAAGSAVLSEGRYDNLRYGIKLRGMAMEVRGNGDRLEIASLTARTPGKGRISGNGGITLGGDMPVEIAVKLERALVIDTDLARAVVDADLGIIGTVKQELSLAGRVSVPKSEIRIPDRLPASVQEIEVIEVNAPPERARAIKAAKAQPPRTVAINLDVRIDVRQMMIRGRGLETEMEGSLKVAGTADLPIVTGEVGMRRGTFDIVGRRLTFNRGRVEFDGGEKIDPILDFEAVSKVDAYDISINVGNRASQPKISLSSTPTLPEDEVLSQLLFEKSSGELTAFEALQLAQAAAELAGVSTGIGMLDAIRGATGLDHLSVNAGDGKTGPSLSAGRYVTDRVYVGVKQGSAANSSAAQVEIDMTDNIKLETELGADAGKAGINWEWDY
ncbi:autotransporter secretion inner membrane protein TamB [Dongia mobilis]|uniref:Autotransporter secretion inner membrane protein TamB n=1 Tax=Dongia mobilis TaxID=578943 RepID=A0A4R6WQE4_9PROT|nr:translocation/assembly module TamB domain-containing protein [Dongia mobilis]TDQ80858.1 autotransporter secretion inner membrane protein TamB [Dongia mobilis]